MIARCITSCRERNGNAAPRSNRGWWPRLEYLDRRRDQVDAVPPSLQAAPDGGRSRYKTCQGTVFEAGLHRLARLPVDPLRTVGPARPRRLPTLLSDRQCDLPARRIQHAPVPQSGDQDDPWTPTQKDRSE